MFRVQKSMIFILKSKEHVKAELNDIVKSNEKDLKE